MFLEINYYKMTLTYLNMNINKRLFISSSDTFQVASYFGNRAAAYVMLTQFSKALEDARKSTQLDPNFTKVVFWLVDQFMY